MIRSLTLAAFLATLGTAPLVAAAQSAPAPAAPTAPAANAPADVAPPHPHRLGRLARALRELDLTPDQHARARAAMQAYRTSRATATPETRAQLRANVESILTPAQRTRFEATMRRPVPEPVASPA